MAYFARSSTLVDPELMQRVSKIVRGELDLEWMRLDTEPARCRPRQADRGLTYEDTNVGRYGYDAIPEKIRHNFSMAPRGAVLPGNLPHLGYTINRKSEVWSDNAVELYEEAKSRHWAAAREIPWGALREGPYPEEKERALAQLYTGLSSMAMAMQDLALRWVWQINQELLEVKSFLCAQTLEAAQLADACRKRAIAGGCGLGHDQIELEDLLKGVLEGGSYPCVSSSGNLLLAKLMQALLRHLGAVASNPADQALVSLGVQDVTRWLAYGSGHVRQLLAARPHEEPALTGHLEEIDNLAVGFLGAPTTVASLALATAGSRAAARNAVSAVARLYRQAVSEYLTRCRAAGLGDRRATSPLPGLVDALEGREAA
jgi:hypothetical protein